MRKPWRISKALGLLLSIFTFTACDAESPGSEEICAEGRTICDSICVDLDTSRSHCGACGRSCEGEEVCVEGSCVLICDEGLEACEGACVNLDRDPENCGQCGTVCDFVCQEGTCLPRCRNGLTDCDGSCVDLDSNPSHCGGCGLACGASEVCIEGVCGCPEGQERCGDVCVDTRSELDHCGACDQVCSGGPNRSATCNEGVCVTECAEGFEDCDGDPENGCEADLASPSHCGACGVSCRADQLCTEGGCACPEGLEACDGACVDLTSDPANCGGCGISCEDREFSEGGLCEEGACVLSCIEHQEDCDGDPENGCEVPTYENVDHCGGCGIACRDDQVCEEAQCQCPAGEMDCEGLCVATSFDRNNCGGCGNVCEIGCGGGTCEEVLSFSARVDHGCALLSGVGSLKCWGYNRNGQIGDGQVGTNALIPTYVLDGSDPAGRLTDAVQVVTGFGHSCALTSAQTVKCWGFAVDSSGTPYDATTPAEILDPTHPSGLLSDVVQLASGRNFICALQQGGGVKCWGAVPDGTNATDATVIQPLPQPVLASTDPELPLTGVVQVAAGNMHACALLTDGTVKCWGKNEHGQLGTGDTEPSLVPLQVGGSTASLDDVEEIAVSQDHSCARTSDGHVYCWGRNNAFQTGTEEATPVPLPVQVMDVTNAVQLSAGITNHTCARLGDGRAKCWGSNASGKLGNGASSGNHLPQYVSGGGGEPLGGILHIEAGNAHTCALMQSGGIFCWGRNNNGQIGNGTTVTASQPTAVSW